jgi:glycosyltransferase involved in cell wall biosynthesis
MNRKCRILYGLEAADGGSLKHLLYLVLKLDKALFDITVMLSEKRSLRVYQAIDKMQQAGAKVIVMPMERSISPWKDLKAMLSIYRHLRAVRYDVVHAHSSKAGVLFRIASRLAGVKRIIYTPHCFYFQSKTGLVRYGFAAIERIMSVFTHHMVVSNGERKGALRYRIANAAKFSNINNAINFDEYDTIPINALPAERQRLRGQLGIRDGNIVVGAVGRLTRQKDWETYIYAAAETLKNYPGAIFLIVGEGELMDTLKLLINRLGLTEKVIITGYREDIPQVFSIIDIYVSTSLWEGLPYVILEALWFKKPVIATDLDYGEIIQDNQNGYLVSCRDYRLIAGKIGHLIRDEQLGKDMGKNGYLLAQKCLSFKTFVRKHEELYLTAHL